MNFTFFQEWKEVARWIKYQEEVEEAGNRWSKPHISTPSLPGWMTLRSSIRNGLVMFDMQAPNFASVCDQVAKELVANEHVSG